MRSPVASLRLRLPMIVTGVCLCVSLAACSRPTPSQPQRRVRWPLALSELGLYQDDLARLEPAEGVVPYDVNTPSFVDYALSYRVVKLPRGTSAIYHETGNFDFPIGTIIARTFAYPHDAREPLGGRRLIETRVLLREEDEWVPLPYVWDEEQSDATLRIIGGTYDVEWVRTDGERHAGRHVVPNLNDCKRCHKNETTTPIGTKARHLNREFAYAHGVENQLAYWKRIGILKGAPPPDGAGRLPDWNDETTGSVEQRARAWLEVNCAHCHNARGPARNSGLYLAADVREPYKYGVYKTPVAAGRGTGGLAFDIVPGQPDDSILVYRLASTEPGVLMPEYGRSLVHEESLALVRQWIASIEKPDVGQPGELLAIAASLTPQQVVQMAEEVRQGGDPARGEDLFRRKDLNCLTCHAVGGVGGRVGPDLAKLEANTTVEYLIESVLLPSKKIKEGFEAFAVLTDAGQMYTGILVREEAGALVLRDHTRGEFRVPLDEIEDRAPAPSLMPTNVAASLTREQLLDLVAFLTQIGQPGAFALSEPQVVRAWQTLDPVPAEFAEFDASLASTFVAESEELVWESVYSRLSGVLPLEPLPQAPNSRLRFIRFHVEANEQGDVRLVFDSATGLILWIGDRRVAAEDELLVELNRGTTTVTILVDLAHREVANLRCEVISDADSTAEIRIVDAM